MPTPIAHGLASLVVGAPAKRAWLWLPLAGVAPDLDLLWNRHSMETHSIGAAVIAGALTWLFTKDRRAAVLVALVWVAHPVMDALGEDSSVPYGVMLWWPFSTAHIIAPIHIFDSVYRAFWRPDFLPHMIPAVAKELAILAPMAIAAAIWRRSRGSKSVTLE